MKKYTNVKFTKIDSSIKGTKEFVVTYDLNGKHLKDFIFIDEKEGLSDAAYLRSAKEKFNAESHPTKMNLSKSSSTALKVIAGCAGVVAITLGGLFAWKMLTNNQAEPGPTPGGDTRTVTWDLGNGKTVKEEYKIGEMPSYKGETPSKPDDTEYDEDRMKYHYTFNGWQEELLPVTEDVTYHVNYLKESLFMVVKINMMKVLVDEGNSTYYFNQPQDADEASAWEVDWDDGDITVDQNAFSHTYTTAGIKYIKIHSVCKSLRFVNDDGEKWAVTNLVMRRVTIPYGWDAIGRLDSSWRDMFDSINLETIDIPTSVTHIYELAGEEMLDPSETAYLHIPNSVKVIDKHAFTGFVFKENLVIPDSVTTIAEGAFFQCSMGYLTLPKSVTSYPSESLYMNELYNYHVIDFSAYDVPPTIAADTFNTGNQFANLWHVRVRPDTYDAFYNAWDSILGEEILDGHTTPSRVAERILQAY